MEQQKRKLQNKTISIYSVQDIYHARDQIINMAKERKGRKISFAGVREKIDDESPYSTSSPI